MCDKHFSQVIFQRLPHTTASRPQPRELLLTLMEPGSWIEPPAFRSGTKEATPKEVRGAGLKNLTFCAFQAPFSASGLYRHAHKDSADISLQPGHRTTLQYDS